MWRLCAALVCLSVAFGESSTQASTKNGTTPTVITNGTTPTMTTNGTTPIPTKNGTTPTTATNGTTPTTTTNGTTPTPSKNGTTTTAPTNGTTTTATTNGTTTTATTNGTTSKPTPTTPPTPSYGNYTIKKDGKFCLLAQFEAKFTISYVKRVEEGNKTITTKAKGTVVLNSLVPVNITGNCGMLSLTWTKQRPFYTLSIEFAGNDSSSTWRLSSVSFLANLKNNPKFPNATEGVVNASYTLFPNTSISGTNGSYYYCKKDTTFTLMAGKKDYQVQADFMDWKVEPFVQKNSEDFGSGKDCYQDHPTSIPTPTKSPDSDIVPIAVGCALAGLVLIVLIAYVIGRRKSHRGYEKV